MKLPVVPYVFDWRHLKTVNETYWQHLSWVLYSTVMLLAIAVVGFIHGVFPFLFPEAPDALAVRWNKKFRERRERTGQSNTRPE